MNTIALRLASASTSRAARLTPRAWTQAKRVPLVPARNVHVRRPLPYNIEDGMGELLSPEALNMIAVEYQQGLLDRLNEQTKGSPLSNQSVAQIVIETAPDQSRSLAFNYASQALNNSFFLHHLKPPPEGAPNHEKEIAINLMGAIKHQMGTVENVRSIVSAAANGMISTGWVWFVTDRRGNIGVIATYGAGTLLASNRTQRDSPGGVEYGGVYVHEEPKMPEGEEATSDMIADPSPSAPFSGVPPSSPTSGLARQVPPLHPSSPSRALHTSASLKNDIPTPPSVYGTGQRTSGPRQMWNDSGDAPELKFNDLGSVVFPLFCVSVQEHAWVGAGYGVWGKEEYMKRFWTCLNWKEVSLAYDRFADLRRIRVPS